MAIDYTKNVITSGYNLAKINDNFDKIQTALADGLSRSGDGPNQMEADIDLNSNDLLNVNSIETTELYIDGERATPTNLVNTSNFATAAQGVKADTALQASTPILPTPSIVGRSLAARFTRDWPSVLDWDAQGSVVGGNANAFSYAFEQAHKSGLSVRLPPSENGLAYLCNPIDLTPQQLKSVVLGAGGSYTAIIQPSGPMDHLFSIGGTLVTTGMYSFEDPNNYINSGGSFIRTYKTTPDNLPISLVGISASGGQWVWKNDYADSVHWDGREGFILNSHGFLYNISGGVGNIVENVRGQGIKYGEVIDADVTNPSAPKQSEGLIFRNNTLLCTQANAVGRWIRSGLDIKSYGCTHGQLGSSGVGLLFDANVTGKAVYGYASYGDWVESGQNGWAIQSTGNVNTIEFFGPKISYGGAVTAVNGVSLTDVQNFSFYGGTIVDPAGYTGTAFAANNSSGLVSKTRLTPGSITETSNCIIKWDGDYYPTGSRSLSSYYPDYTTYTPIVSASSGTITSSTATGRWKKSGKMVTVVVNLTIATNGTGAGTINITLPFSAKTGSSVPFTGYGRENGLTGKMVQGYVGGGFSTATLVDYNNTYPGGTGAVIWFQIEYEID